MKNIKELSSSNLFKLLKNFSKEELIEFEKYVSSPLYNSQGTLVRLLGELKLHYPEFSGEDFTKEILFSKVNPGKKYNDDIFRKYMSNLFKLAEGYLIYLENKTAWDRQTVNLLDQFDKRNLKGFYDKHLDQAENNSELSRIISNESF